VWKQLIANFKAAGTDVTVLGSVDPGTTTSQYDAFDMDGFYFTSAVEDTYTGTSVLALGAPLFDETVLGESTSTCEETQITCNGGETESGANLGDGGQIAGGILVNSVGECCDLCGTTAGCTHYAYSPGPSLPNVCWLKDACIGTTKACDGVTEQCGLAPTASPSIPAGQPGVPDVIVTLASSNIGIWSPFSWYPYVSPLKWSAMVTEAADVTAVEALFDRGYGYVYLTSETGFETKSTVMTALLAEIQGTATRRKLQERRLEASAPFWGCDDTLFECKPICLKKMGVVTQKVSDTLCAAAPMDQCACKCFHEAQWTCENEKVVCKARFGAGELKIVGDKVCETRGAPKPASSELRLASKCEPVTEMRGSSPTAQCLDQWGTPEPSDAPTDAPTNALSNAPADFEQFPLLEESCASALVLAAFALNA
jgi:hypothetical protein